MKPEFQLQGAFAKTYCRGPKESKQIDIKYTKSPTENVDRLNRHYHVVLDKNGVPLNCPRYEDGMCRTFELGEALPSDARILIGHDGIGSTIKLVRHKCVAGAKLQEVLGNFNMGKES